jgi:EAL and modified HD-GYP domain-containing signal transduction protein
MLNWLKKALAPETGSRPAETAKPVAEKPATPLVAATTPLAKEKEKPLKAPSKILDDSTEDNSTGLLARQAIMNREHRLIGYEFSLPNQSSHQDLASEQSQRSNEELLVRTMQTIGIEKLARFRQLWLRVSDTFIASPLIESLPAAETVLLFSISQPSSAVNQNLISRAGELKNAGYKLALGNWSNTLAHHAWLALLDYVVIDATAHNPLEIEEYVQTIAKQAPTIEIMACKLESIEEFEFCHQSRYHLFQGNFLTKRENWGKRPPISTDRARLCDLLNRLRGGSEIAEIAKQLRYSPTLAYRLLRYINSAAMGLPSRVASIESGLVFLGREKLYRWFTLLLFNADDTKSTDGALLEQALVRGRMVEILAAEKFSRQQCDELFVVGMFSLLDVLMKLPMSIALDPLQLPSMVTSALIGDTGDYASYLRLAVACETNDFGSLEREAEALALSVDCVNAAHFDALSWTQDALAPAENGAHPA